MDNPSLTSQILAWINGLSLPTLLAGAFGFSRWITKKEQEAKASVATVAASVENLKENHLHHIQESLDGIKTGMGKMADQATENTRDIVTAIRASQDAVVSAILTVRN